MKQSDREIFFTGVLLGIGLLSIAITLTVL
jgi:hypothetical protein